MIVDWSRINSLIDTDNAEDQLWLENMLTTLLENMETRISNITQFTKSQDEKSLQSELHQVKGVAANFGLTSFYNIVLLTESKLKENHKEEAFDLTNSVIQSWIETREAIKNRK